MRWLLKYRSHPVSPYSTVARLIVGILLLAPGTAKFLDPQSFIRAMMSMTALPPEAIPAIAFALPPAEIITGFLVLLGKRYGFWIAFALNFGFLLFLILNGFVVGQNVECGCFGGIVSAKTDVWGVTRQIVLILLNGTLLLRITTLKKLPLLKNQSWTRHRLGSSVGRDVLHNSKRGGGSPLFNKRRVRGNAI